MILNENSEIPTSVRIPADIGARAPRPTPIDLRPSQRQRVLGIRTPSNLSGAMS